jgi:hypothetical protein
MIRIGTLSFATHGRTILQLLTAPGTFFENRRDRLVSPASLVFLVISTLLFTVASLVFQQSPKPLVTSAILIGNALGMVLILSFISYMVMILSMGQKASYRQVLSVFAYASGTSFMIAWIPHMLIVSEPWRWYLIGIGLTRGCGLKWMGSIWIMICSITITTIFFRSILPLLQA